MMADTLTSQQSTDIPITNHQLMPTASHTHQVSRSMSHLQESGGGGLSKKVGVAELC